METYDLGTYGTSLVPRLHPFLIKKGAVTFMVLVSVLKQMLAMQARQ